MTANTYVSSSDICCVSVPLLQDEIAALKQQLGAERQAAASAQEQRAAAVEQLHLAEERHQQQLQQMEENVKGFKWKLWEVEADAARRGYTGHDAQHQQQQQRQQQLQSKDAWRLQAVSPGDGGQDVRGARKVDGDAGMGMVVDDATGGGRAADAGWASRDGRFAVELVERPGPADQLEMLPEVLRLFELHRSTMSSSIL
jgi:predicted secreted protein